MYTVDPFGTQSPDCYREVTCLYMVTIIDKFHRMYTTELKLKTDFVDNILILNSLLIAGTFFTQYFNYCSMVTRTGRCMVTNRIQSLDIHGVYSQGTYFACFV